MAANRADPGDHLTEFYLAFHYAQTRDVARATQRVRRALVLQPEHLPSLHLMALLLTAKGELTEALEVADQVGRNLHVKESSIQISFPYCRPWTNIRITCPSSRSRCDSRRPSTAASLPF